MGWWTGIDGYGEYEVLTPHHPHANPYSQSNSHPYLHSHPTCNPTLPHTPTTSSTVNPTLPRTLTLNFMPTTPQPAQPHLQPIPPALVLCQSCLDPSHNPKLLPNPTSNPNSFGESGFGETGFGEPGGHPLVVVSIGQYK